MANLFKEKILKRKLENYEVPDFENKLEVVKKWHKVYENGSLKKKTESQCEQDFNQDFFIKVLDYIPFPNESYTIEPKSKSESKGGQTPDATLGFFNGSKSTQVVCEIKDVNTSLDKSQRREGNLSPVQQAFKYKPLFSTCNFVIATNFYDIRLYKDTILDYEQWTLDYLIDPEDNYFNFKKFYYLLSSSNLIAKEGKSNTDGLISEIRIEQEQITKDFYKEYKGLRSELIDNLKKNNTDKEINFLIEKAQKIIDRIVFVHFCEDLDLLPEGKFLEVVNYAGQAFVDIWATMRGFFNAVDKGSDKLGIPDGYNGELFKPDPDLDYLKIDDDICKKFAELGKFDFSEDLTVNILGHIFEQSISDIEELKEEINDKKQSKRKKDGIFYTPDYIVDYIVKNSLGAYLQEVEEEILKSYNLINVKENLKDENYKKRMLEAYENYQNKLRNIKVLDPACGSGAFLVKVFDYLFEENKRVSKQISSYSGGALSLFDTDSYIKDILQNNIYGVDLNPESVEITKLSLWLKTAQKGKKLTNLKGNIKCGNSLIDDKEVAGDKAFKWDEEFKQVMNGGGFDVVVGNPPYLRVQGLREHHEKESKFYDTKYKSATGNYDIYILFMEKGLELIKEKGKISFILPHKFLVSDFGIGIREILAQNKVERLIHFGSNMVFEDASTYTCIITLSNDNEVFNFKQINPLEILSIQSFETIDYKSLCKEKWNLADKETLNILEKIKKQPKTVKDVFSRIFVGLQTSADKIYLIKGSQTDNLIKGYSASLEKEIEIETGLVKPLLKGEDVSKYKYLENDYFVIFPYLIENGKASNMTEDYIKSNFPKGYEYLKANEKELRDRERGRFDNDKEWFLFSRKQGLNGVEQPKIITPEISLGTNMTFDEGKFYHNTQCYSFIKKEGVKEDYHFWLCILNSSLMWFFLKNTGTVLRGGYFRFKTKYLEPFPLPELKTLSDQKPFKEKADKMLDLNKQFQEKLSKTINLIKSEYNIDKTPKKLEKFYKLDFEEFISVLKIKKLSLSQKEELMDYFNSKKDELTRLKAEIDSTDREIDDMVFDLYGLTDEERKIVLES